MDLVIPNLERCFNGCCCRIDSRPATEAEYEAALDNLPYMVLGAVEPGKRGAVIQTTIACRG
jgi:hypothetical protein